MWSQKFIDMYMYVVKQCKVLGLFEGQICLE